MVAKLWTGTKLRIAVANEDPPMEIEKKIVSEPRIRDASKVKESQAQPSQATVRHGPLCMRAFRAHKESETVACSVAAVA